MSSPLPQHCPTPRELDDLELLLNGALAPRDRFDSGDDAVITLDLPPALREQEVELVDPEGLPLATVAPDGTLTALATPAHGPFRRLRLSPAEAHAAHAGRSWIAVDDALTSMQISRLSQRGPLVLLALVGAGTPKLSPVNLVRATLAAAEELPDAVVVVVPLATHPEADSDADATLRDQVVATYAGADPLWPLPDHAGPVSAADRPAAVAAVVAQDRPAPDQQGVVVFFTGLSGSGKSTLARALTDLVLEQGKRSVTSLDGDVVRRNLSAGLTFSREDRETNIRHIGWVAAEIARHGGLAVVSPIAPFAATRAQVREYVEEAGGRFFLVHVATPLAECERRDRKGLYAKARAGEIPEFTGISSPYEAPDDADVVVNTAGRSVEAALADVLAALRAQGLLDVEQPGDLRDADTTSFAAVSPRTGPIRTTNAPATRTDIFAGAPARVATHERDERDAHLAVAFVCTANICRSPYMEMQAQRLAGSRIEIVSVGTEAVVGRRMDPEMVPFAPKRAAERFRSNPVSRQLVEAADLLLCAEQSHMDALLERYPGEFRKIFTVGQFAATVQGASLTGRALISQAGMFRAPHLSEYDIADPYKNGPEAAKAAVEQINGYLDVIMPALTGHRDASAS
ncbi:adenylyl-sulfate kinase [Nocardioides yefusunii]|uniref:adenylyl-sulfate kinase n=1 Tax=Nocardioides yefusunii TaxID=2500546 RepID=A0ABW1QV26_9ACTN|nr:adenylyl-sulfate kinase [Nocardioides yefusunii]